MRKLLVALCLSLAALVIALPGLAGDRTAEYEMEVLDYPGASYTSPYNINNRGEIVGTFFTPDGPGSFLYYKGEFSEITVPGAFATYALGNNDRGDIAGWYFTPELVNLGFVMDKHGDVTTLSVEGAFWTDGLDVNNAGVVLGQYRDATGLHGFLYRDGVYEYPIDVAPPDPALPPGSTIVRGLNDRGQIAGAVSDFESYTKAFIMEPDGSLTWYEAIIPGDDNPGMGFFDLNNNGVAVGTGIAGIYPDLTFIAWMMDRGDSVLFDDIPGALDSYIQGVNDRGNMVGYFWDGTQGHGLIISKK